MARLFLLAALLVSIAGATAPLLENPARMVLVDGYAFVSATINGHGPFILLIDTGASACALSPDLAKAAKLAFDQRTEVVTATGRQVVPSARSTRVQVGAQLLDNVEVV